MSADENENPYVRVFHRPPQYLVQEWDLEKIDSLIAALGLAVGEILGRRAIQEQNPENECAAQNDFDAQIQEVFVESEIQSRTRAPE